MDAVTDMDLSIAQVEAELRAAEAYLTSASRSSKAREERAAEAAPSAQPSPYERMRQPLADSNSSFFKRPARARAPIPEERRREILAKLSSERQAAVRGHARPPSASESLAPTPRFSQERSPAKADRPESRFEITPVSSVDFNREYDDPMNRTHRYGQLDYGVDTLGGDSDGDEDSEGDDEEDEDEGEVFYASDVIGKPLHEQIQPRTALDLFNIDEDDNSNDAGSDLAPDASRNTSHDDNADEFTATAPTNYRETQLRSEPDNKNDVDEDHSTSIFAKVFVRREEWYKEADIHNSQLLASQPVEQAEPAKGNPPDTGPANNERDPAERVEDHECDMSNTVSRGEEDIDTTKLYNPLETVDGFGSRSMNPATTAKATSSRIERLAQPRTRVFADREKQRLVNEMKALKECTFQPALLASSKSPKRVVERLPGDHTAKKSLKAVHFEINTTKATSAFPWLTLSPRRSASRLPRKKSQNLIDRLNLDVTVKYEARERLRQMLEAEKMRECTFRPKINPASRRLLSGTDYKPIHERVNELQREKIECIQRIREELAYEEGAFTFAPVINPRSREIAATVLTDRQVSKVRASTRALNVDDERQLQALLKPPPVTERLIQDAEQIAEKRVAIQEYYDALEDKSFIPAISEASNRLIEGKPEFKLDFLSRQEYFRMVEQERLEVLEDIVHHEQELTFRPDIGNAKKVLREMRPDLIQETAQQRLDRLVYREPRRKEFVKQKLREEVYAKMTFKPQINPISTALVEKAKTEATSKSARRHELQRYFAGKHFRSRVAKELEQAERAECTFRPQLISRPRAKSSSTSKLLVKERQQSPDSMWRSDNILHTIETQRQQRAEDLEAKRNALELKELENCTFQPNTHRPPRRGLSDPGSRSEKIVVVRGLGRFLELKERAKRQQEERKKREEKVFHPQYAYEPRSYTIPKPFKLSETSRDSIRRRLKLREEMRSKERDECTFAPRTLEAQQRQVLRTLLKD